jgi:hypothetical protein
MKQRAIATLRDDGEERSRWKVGGASDGTAASALADGGGEGKVRR